MACLIKPPQGSAKGAVSFTTPERDLLIQAFPDIVASAAALKSRYLLGLHHNWHDARFRHDPLFDFNLAGEDDLVSDKPFPLITMDACNFSPPMFAPGGEKFWDILFVARAVKFKGIPQFFRAIRALYDRGDLLRVLVICPTPAAGHGTENGLREIHNSLFTAQERHYFTFLTADWDYPFPFDLPTLAHFYRASRIFVHSAPDERRCRVAGYAWAAGMPVVGKACVGSILPAALRVPPFFFECGDYKDFPGGIRRALDVAATAPDFTPVRKLVSGANAVQEMDVRLRTLASALGTSLASTPVNPTGLDLRLGRHHGLAVGANRIEQDIGAFIAQLCSMTDAELIEAAAQPDPEMLLAARSPRMPRALKPAQPARSRIVGRLRRLVGVR